MKKVQGGILYVEASHAQKRHENSAEGDAEDAEFVGTLIYSRKGALGGHGISLR
jgi:hypothetical protein